MKKSTFPVSSCLEFLMPEAYRCNNIKVGVANSNAHSDEVILNK